MGEGSMDSGLSYEPGQTSSHTVPANRGVDLGHSQKRLRSI